MKAVHTPDNTVLPPELIEAYRTAFFRVNSEPPFDLMIGKYSDELQEFYLKTNHYHFSFITACNPKGEECSAEENQKYHQELKDHVTSLGLTFTEGVGGDVQGIWPPEESLYIPNISLLRATFIGDIFLQNAIVYGDYKATPQLVVLR